MISTSLLTFATSLALGMAPSASAPSWQSDYSAGLSLSAQSQKPVLVLLAKGEAAKTLTPAVADRLKSDFVCVYADVNTLAGRELASTFQLEEGVIISDRGGKLQALHYAGTVSPETLGQYAEQFKGTTPISSTTYVGTTPVSAPVVVSAPVYAAPVVQYAPGMSSYAPVYRTGGCPNGRCGR